MFLYHPEYPPSVSISLKLPRALASEGILPRCGIWLVTYSFKDENHGGVIPFLRLMGCDLRSLLYTGIRVEWLQREI